MVVPHCKPQLEFLLIFLLLLCQEQILLSVLPVHFRMSLAQFLLLFFLLNHIPDLLQEVHLQKTLLFRTQVLHRFRQKTLLFRIQVLHRFLQKNLLFRIQVLHRFHQKTLLFRIQILHRFHQKTLLFRI